MFAWVGPTADVVSLLAAAVTAIGLASAWCTRPRVQVDTYLWPGGDAAVRIRLRKGMTPAGALRLSWASIDDDLVAWSGDGDENSGIQLLTALYPDSWFLLHVYGISETVFADGPRDNELRLGVRADRGFIMDLSWQSPILRWKRTHSYVLWTPSSRHRQEKPSLLGRRDGKKRFAEVMKSSRRGSLASTAA